MYPFLDILGRQIPTYGLMAAAGIVCGLLYVFLRTDRKLDRENALYIYTFGILGAGLGAKILYLLISLNDIAADVRSHGLMRTAVAYIRGGMVFYGGLLGAIAAAFLTARFLKEDIAGFYHSLVPGIAILAGFGRIGCFLNGCCFGAVTDCPVHVIFPAGSDAPAGVPLVPVQLYEAVFEFAMALLFTALTMLKPSLEPRFLRLYLMSYAIFRFILEFWRGDAVRGMYGPFSTSQWISLGIIIFAAARGVIIRSWRS